MNTVGINHHIRCYTYSKRWPIVSWSTTLVTDVTWTTRITTIAIPFTNLGLSPSKRDRPLMKITNGVTKSESSDQIYKNNKSKHKKQIRSLQLYSNFQNHQAGAYVFENRRNYTSSLLGRQEPLQSAYHWV